MALSRAATADAAAAVSAAFVSAAASVNRSSTT